MKVEAQRTIDDETFQPHVSITFHLPLEAIADYEVTGEHRDMVKDAEQLFALYKKYVENMLEFQEFIPITPDLQGNQRLTMTALIRIIHRKKSRMGQLERGLGNS